MLQGSALRESLCALPKSILRRFTATRGWQPQPARDQRFFEHLEGRVMLSIAPGGSEFLLDQTTAGTDNQVVVADVPDGFLAVWASDDSIHAQRYDTTGAAVGDVIDINDAGVANDSDSLSVATDADGNFVVVWSAWDGADRDIFARSVSADGASISDLVQINTTDPGDQDHPDVAVDGQGNIIVAWQGDGAAGQGVYIQRFDGDGNFVGGETRVDNVTAGQIDLIGSPAVAADAAGNFVVVWSQRSELDDQDLTFLSSNVQAQRFDTAGAEVGGQITVGEDPSAIHDITSTDVAMDADGDFVVGWTVYRNETHTETYTYEYEDGTVVQYDYDVTDFQGSEVYTRRVAADGTLGDQTQVAATDENTEAGQVALAIDADGDYVVAWSESAYTDSYDQTRPGVNRIMAQRFDVQSGEADGDAFVANETDRAGLAAPGVTIKNNDNVVIAWQGQGGADAAGQADVFGRLFAVEDNEQVDELVDLGLAIDGWDFDGNAVQGESGTVSVTVSNDGETDIDGPVTIVVYLNDGEGGQVEIGRVEDQHLTLTAGESASLDIDVQVPEDLPPGSYTLQAVLTADQVGDENAANDTALGEGQIEVVVSGGLEEIGILTTRNQTFFDENGQEVIARISRGASGRVLQDSEGRLYIEISDTAPVTDLILRTRTRGGVDNDAGIAGITVDGNLRQINAVGVDLNGDVIVNGALWNSVRFDDIRNANIVSDQVRHVRDRLYITADQVSNTSVDSATPIARIIATEWIDDDGTPDVISAPSVGVVQIRGDRRRDLRGDFGADIVTTNQSVALSSFDVKGLLTGSNIRLAGNAYTVRVGAVADSNFLVGVNDDVNGLAGSLDDFARAGEIRLFQVRGLADMDDVSNSNITASRIRDLRLREVDTDNDGGEFGVSALRIDRYSRPEVGTVRPQVGSDGDIDGDNDFVVRLIDDGQDPAGDGDGDGDGNGNGNGNGGLNVWDRR